MAELALFCPIPDTSSVFFNNLVALFSIRNLSNVSGRLLQGLQQLVRLPRLPLGLGGTGPGMIGASGVFLLRLPVELQRPAQLALVLGLLAHQVDLGAVAGGQAGVGLIRGDFHELAVVELVEAEGALLGGQQGLEQQQALRLTLSLLGIRVLGFGIRGRVCGVALSLNPALGCHKAAEDVAQVGALQARLLAV